MYKWIWKLKNILIPCYSIVHYDTSLRGVAKITKNIYIWSNTNCITLYWHFKCSIKSKRIYKTICITIFCFCFEFYCLLLQCVVYISMSTETNSFNRTFIVVAVDSALFEDISQVLIDGQLNYSRKIKARLCVHNKIYMYVFVCNYCVVKHQWLIEFV